jgi:RHS repeat-associated protein
VGCALRGLARHATASSERRVADEPRRAGPQAGRARGTSDVQSSTPDQPFADSGFGAIDTALRYDAYGELIGSTLGDVPSPWRFGGRLALDPDGGTDLYDWDAREYDVGLGAFTSLDTVAGSVEHPLTLNRYLFTHANPTSLIDPDGHCVRIDGNVCIPQQGQTPPPASSGRFVVTLSDSGLGSAGAAVNTIAHELNHIREILRNPPGYFIDSEAAATIAGNLAERFMR